MKRKLALLLAAVMIIAALPMNVFAASTNKVTRTINADNKTLFYEQGTTGITNTFGNVSGNSSIEYWVDGTELKIELKDGIDVGKYFELELENARWFFRQTINGSTTNDSAAYWSDYVYDGTNSDVNTAIDGIGVGVVVTGDTEDGLLANDLITREIAQAYLDGVELDYTGAGAITVPVAGTLVSALAAVDDKIDAYMTAKGISELGSAVLDGLTGSFPGGTGNGFGTTGQWNAGGETTRKAAGGTYVVGKHNIVTVDNSARYSSDEATAVAEGIVQNILEAIAGGAKYFSYKPGVRLSLESNGDGTFDIVTVNLSGGNPVDFVFTDFNMPIIIKAFRAGGGGNVVEYNNSAYDTTFNSTAPNQLPNKVTTYNTAKGVMVYDPGRQVYTYTRYESTPGTVSDGEVAYTLEVGTRTNERVAKVTSLQKANVATSGNNPYFLIPLVMLTNAEGDYRVKVNSQISEVSHGTNLLIGSKIAGKTNATTTSVTTKRNEFEIGRLVITELKSGSLFNSSTWKFEIRAPRGYYFDSATVNKMLPSEADAPNYTSYNSNITVYTDGGLRWNEANGAQIGRMPILGGASASTTTQLVDMAFKDYKNEIDDSVIEVTVQGGAFSRSSNATGHLYFRGLKLVAEDDDSIPFGEDVYLTLRNVAPSTQLTEQDVKVGTATDYDITLTRVGEAPELVSGRMEAEIEVTRTSNDYNEVSNVLVNGDKYHQAADVKFTEKVPDAWWAQRNTVFTLPEEVRFMKVEFRGLRTADSYLVQSSIDNLLKGSNGTPTSSNTNSAPYYNTRNRRSNVTIDNNKMTLTNLAVKDDETAVFTIRTWLSVRADFEGDIDMTLGNSAFKYQKSDDVSVTIAKAIRPVEIETKVTEAKVGYQYVTVADFDIVENKAGNLIKGNEVYVTVTDQISLDMSIAKGFLAEVTEGNLKIKDINTMSVLGNFSRTLDRSQGAQLTFMIDKESTVASTISFTNVQVKVDRSVPYSNVSNNDERGIDIFVWGPAVANNYYYLHTEEIETNDATRLNGNDYFTVAGINEKYVNVVTLAADSNQSAFTNNVAVTMGATTYTVNGQEYTLEVAPYVSTKSNSAMVPLRFVAYALGLNESAVKWDAANSVATVDAGTRVVAFQTGSSYYWVNGTQVPMVSPDGLPVEMEITGERAFVPMRALADAFNISISWEPTTSTVTYNAPTAQ